MTTTTWHTISITPLPPGYAVELSMPDEPDNLLIYPAPVLLRQINDYKEERITLGILHPYSGTVEPFDDEDETPSRLGDLVRIFYPSHGDLAEPPPQRQAPDQ